MLQLASHAPRAACRRPRLLPLRPNAMSSTFPTPAERNRQLAQRLKQALGEAAGEASYSDIKAKAAAFRAGRLEAVVGSASLGGGIKANMQ